MPVLVIADEQSDHMANGLTCAELGVGAVLPVDGSTADAVARAAQTLLSARLPDGATGRVRRDIAELPGLDVAVGAIARVASGARAPNGFQGNAGRNVH